jgi:nicotinate-nucleotide pyrophosphorylase (carboxylating)
VKLDPGALPDPVEIALAEDLGLAGDITGAAFVDPAARARGRIVARERAVVAGLDVVERVFRLVDEAVAVERSVGDGEEVAPGAVLVEVEGCARSVLAAERTALNFLQRLSGVATLTRRFVEAVRGTQARIFDTRKTTPGLRALEKAAVRAGGGENHRLGLHDAVLVKDNHWAMERAPASLQARIDEVRRARPGVVIEFEADTLDQVRLLVGLRGVDVILLDNMNEEMLREAVGLRRPGLEFEASGGVTLESVRRIAFSGVDRISVGALTHSARAIDFSLEIERA